MLLDKAQRISEVILVCRINRQNFETLVVVRVVGPLQRRHLSPARWAPACPEIYQYRGAAQIGQADRPPIWSLQSELRGCESLVG